MKNTLTTNLMIFLGCLVLHAQSGDDIRLKYNNPELIVDLGVGLWGYPMPVDYDKDGLVDLLMSCPDTPYKGIYYFRNIGTQSDPLFDKPQRLSDRAFTNTCVSYTPGKMHVFRPGIEYPDFLNTFLKKQNKITPDVTPGHDFVKVRSNMWSYVDYDSDGDLDILIGVDDWGEYGWDNAYNKEGEWTNGPLRGYMYWLENKEGQYINKGKILAGKKPLETFGAPGANMADFDGDGKSDLICGEFVDKLTWFKNTGTRQKPRFAEGRRLLDEAGTEISFHVEMIMPVAFDFDQDGHIDLLVGDEDGRVAFVKNTGKVKKGMPVFKSPVYLKQKADNLKFGALSTPFVVDWDGDGKDDIVAGNSAGNIAFIKNLDGGIPPRWAAPVMLQSNGKEIRIMAGKNGSIQGPCEAKWGYTTLTVADWDNDGLKDIIVNSIFGEIVWYKNTGDLTNMEGPYKVTVDWGNNKPVKPVWNWWNPGTTDLVTQWRTTPVAVDWNGDGMCDLVMLDTEGYLCLYERFAKGGQLWLKPPKRIFFAEESASYDHNNRPTNAIIKPLQLNSGIAGRSGRRKIAVVDWNNDGKLDLVVNSRNVTLFENIRQAGDSIFMANRGELSDVKLAGHDTAPTAVDWEKNGIYDIIAGGEDGHFYWIRNPRKNKMNINSTK